MYHLISERTGIYRKYEMELVVNIDYVMLLKTTT